MCLVPAKMHLTTVDPTVCRPVYSLKKIDRGMKKTNFNVQVQEEDLHNFLLSTS